MITYYIRPEKLLPFNSLPNALLRSFPFIMGLVFLIRYITIASLPLSVVGLQVVTSSYSNGLKYLWNIAILVIPWLARITTKFYKILIENVSYNEHGPRITLFFPSLCLICKYWSSLATYRCSSCFRLRNNVIRQGPSTIFDSPVCFVIRYCSPSSIVRNP